MFEEGPAPVHQARSTGGGKERGEKKAEKQVCYLYSSLVDMKGGLDVGGTDWWLTSFTLCGCQGQVGHG